MSQEVTTKTPGIYVEWKEGNPRFEFVGDELLDARRITAAQTLVERLAVLPDKTSVAVTLTPLDRALVETALRLFVTSLARKYDEEGE